MVGFPLLLIPIALYNAIAFLMPSVSFTEALFSLTLVSGARWPVTLSDILLTLGVLLLLLEVIKGARPGGKYLTDHLLSLIVFGAAAAEFVMWTKFASSTFFLLTLIAMTDFLTSLALRTHRRVPADASAPAVQAERTRVSDSADVAAPVEPKFDSMPPSSPPPSVEHALALPAAASVAESVLMDHPEPKIAQPTVGVREPITETPAEPKKQATREPNIPSPELQPATGSLGSQEQ